MFKYIYKVTNLVNNKIYIGQTVKHPQQRFEEYCNAKYLLGKAVAKYGKENFSLEIIEYTENFNERERFWIDFYDSGVPKGYNIMYGEQFISFSQQEEIIQELYNGLTYKEIAKKYNVGIGLVSGINNGSKYFNSSYDYPIKVFSQRDLTKEKVSEIEQLMLNFSKTIQEFTEENQEYHRTTLFMINKGEHKYSNKNLSFPLCYFDRVIKKEVVKQVEQELKTSKKSLMTIGRQYQISKDSVEIINRGMHRFSTEKNKRIRRVRNLSLEEVSQIEELLKNNSVAEVCKITGRSQSVVRKIKFHRHSLSSKPVETISLIGE